MRAERTRWLGPNARRDVGPAAGGAEVHLRPIASPVACLRQIFDLLSRLQKNSAGRARSDCFEFELRLGTGVHRLPSMSPWSVVVREKDNVFQRQYAELE